MNKISILFLQAVVALVGVAVLAFMLMAPHLEGRNTHATLFQIYFKDPFLAFVYIASIPFFMGLYQTFKALGCAKQNRICSQEGIDALRTIKYCAIAMIGFVMVSVVFLASGDNEDRPPGVFLRALVMFPSIVIAAAAAMFEQMLKNVVEMKSGNKFTGRPDQH